MPDFLRAAVRIIPENSVLYLEGGSPDDEIRSFLEKRKLPFTTKVAKGTIWPRPKIFHVPFTTENVNDFAEIMERHATPEGSIHLHIYKDNKIILQWYDAFFDDPMYISEDAAEEQIKQFCESLSVEYKQLRQ